MAMYAAKKSMKMVLSVKMFLIQTGVGINVFTRLASSKRLANVRYTQKKEAKQKLRSLKHASMQWTTLNMSLYSRSFDHYFFVPKDFPKFGYLFKWGLCDRPVSRSAHP